MRGEPRGARRSPGTTQPQSVARRRHYRGESSCRRSWTASFRRHQSPCCSALVSVGDGEALFRCTPDERTYNPIRIVHGGFLCTLLDSAAGCAVHTILPAGTRYGTIEIKVRFLTPLHAHGGPIEAGGAVPRRDLPPGPAQRPQGRGDVRLGIHRNGQRALVSVRLGARARPRRTGSSSVAICAPGDSPPHG